MDSVMIRPMTEEDLSQVSSLEKACFPDPWSENILKDTLKGPWDELWVLCCGQEILGYANFRFLAGEGELMRIAVHPACRGRGYARKLMDRLVLSSVEQNAAALTLEVRAGNIPAICLYKSYGFKEEAVRKNYYEHPTEDALIFWRRRLPGIPA